MALNAITTIFPSEAPFLGSSTTTTSAPLIEMEAQLANVSLTIYSNPDDVSFDPTNYIGRDINLNSYLARSLNGYAIVSQKDSVAAVNESGQYHCVLQGVAELLDPTTVTFAFESDASATVLDQSYQFDLISSEKILDYYINQSIDLYLPKDDLTGVADIVSGVLLSHDNGKVVLQNIDNSIDILPTDHASFRLSGLPSNLRPVPSLELHVSNHDIANDSEASNTTFDIKTTYKTSGITWRADYNLILDETEESGSLGAWVSILNLAGKSFQDAQLKLIAGDVNTVEPSIAEPMYKYDAIMNVSTPVREVGFEEKSFFEYHMYSLPRLTTLNNSSLSQLALFPTADGVGISKELTFQPISSPVYGEKPYTGPNTIPDYDSAAKVQVSVTFKNDDANNLGIPLPKGKVRVFKQDGDVAEFIGEDLIDHTARNETVSINLGHSFDVKGERSVGAFSFDNSTGIMSETVTLKMTNQKDIATTVTVKDVMYRWMNYTISDCVPDCGQDSAGVVTWQVLVPAEGQAEIKYTVTYTTK